MGVGMRWSTKLSDGTVEEGEVSGGAVGRKGRKWCHTEEVVCLELAQSDRVGLTWCPRADSCDEENRKSGFFSLSRLGRSGIRKLLSRRNRDGVDWRGLALCSVEDTLEGVQCFVRREAERADARVGVEAEDAEDAGLSGVDG